MVVERRVEHGGIRVRAVVEWLVAAGFILALLAAVSMVVRGLRTVSDTLPVMAREAPAPGPPTPAGVPPRAVSVPVLPLSGGRELRVGETGSAVAAMLGTGVDVSPPSFERGPNGDRVTRYYNDAGTRFVIVFEPFERDAEPRVAAIYLQ